MRRIKTTTLFVMLLAPFVIFGGCEDDIYPALSIYTFGPPPAAEVGEPVSLRWNIGEQHGIDYGCLSEDTIHYPDFPYEVTAGPGVSIDSITGCGGDDCETSGSVSHDAFNYSGQIQAVVTCLQVGPTAVEFCADSTHYGHPRTCESLTVTCGPDLPMDGGVDASGDAGGDAGADSGAPADSAMDAVVDAAVDTGFDAGNPTGGCALEDMAVSTRLDDLRVARICQDETCPLLQTDACPGTPLFELYGEGATYSVRSRPGAISATSVGTLDGTGTVVRGIPGGVTATIDLAVSTASELVVEFGGGIVTVHSYAR